MDQVHNQVGPAHLQASESLRGNCTAIAHALVEREFAVHPDLEQRYGQIGRERCYEDACFHLKYLSEALSAGQSGLFTDYIAWAKVMLSGRRIPPSDLARHLIVMEEVLTEMFPSESLGLALDMIRQAREQLPRLPVSIPSFTTHPGLARRYLKTLLNGQRKDASQLIMDAVEHGAGVKEIYLRVFQSTQYEIGRLWQINKISVAQEHYCTAATQLIMSQLYPRILAGEKNAGTFVGACVGGDLHEIGMRMVTDFFEMSGWKTWYLGANTPTASVVQIVGELRPKILGLSATLTPNLRELESLIHAIRSDRACATVQILVGGYPFNVAPDLWRTLGADGSARDAGAVIAMMNGELSQ